MEQLNPDYLRFITLTLAPEDWQDVRKKMKDLVQFLRSRGTRVHWLWVVEVGEENGMKHIHCVQWGDFIPWKELLDWWGARVEIQAANEAIDYLGKNVIKYLGKGIDGDREAIETHMNLNGGRAAHWSRDFFNGMSRKAFQQANPCPGIYFLKNLPLSEETK